MLCLLDFLVQKKNGMECFSFSEIWLHYPGLYIIETISSNQNNHFCPSVLSTPLDFRHCKLKNVSCFPRGPREYWKPAIQHCCHVSCETDADCQEGEHDMGNSTLTDKCDSSGRMSFCSLKLKEIPQWEIHKDSSKKAPMASLRLRDTTRLWRHLH